MLMVVRKTLTLKQESNVASFDAAIGAARSAHVLGEHDAGIAWSHERLLLGSDGYSHFRPTPGIGRGDLRGRIVAFAVVHFGGLKFRTWP